MLPTPTDDAIISQLSYASWKKTTITYSFLDFWYLGIEESMLPTDPDTGLAIAGPENFLTLSESHKNAFNLVQGLWDDLITPSLEAVAVFYTADIKVARFIPSVNQSVTTWESSPDQSPFRTMDDSYIWMYLENEDIGFGYSYRAVLHEFGHALGLFHAGDYNFSADPSDGSSAQDSTVYSVMSYFGPDRLVGEGYVEQANWIKDGKLHVPQTPMMNDILAMQAMYGADLNTRSSATTYGFNASGISGREGVFDFDANKVPIVCIYDADGIDTLDLSGWEQGSVISLIPGTFSDGNGMTKNISIARGTYIENAIGGAGNDVITGNDVSNVLVGGKGNDKLIGGELAATDIDTVDYSPDRPGNGSMTSGIWVDMTKASGQVTNDGFGYVDTLVGIEKLIGSERGDFFNIAGPLKIVDGGDGIDKVSFATSSSRVEIDLNVTEQHGGLAEGVQLTSIEQVDGSTGNDIIRLKATGDTFTWANLGNDTIYGGVGKSTVFGDKGNDVFYHVGGTSTFDGGLAEIDTLDLSLAEIGRYTFDWLRETVRREGNSGTPDVTFNDVETFNGSAGEDTFLFGNEAATFQGRAKFNGGYGNDTIDFSRMTGNTGIQLFKDTTTSDPTAMVVNNWSAGMKFASIEHVVGSAKDDFLVLLNGMKSVKGGDGYDVLDISKWGEGQLIFYMETGKSVFSGNALTIESVESFITRAGQMGVVGTSNGDTFTGSSGADRFWGAGGNDTFNLISAGDFVDGGDDYDTVHLKNAKFTTADIANFKNVEEFHFEGNHQNLTFGATGDSLKVYLSWGVDTVRFADGDGVKTVYAGDGADTIVAWGSGFYDGGTDAAPDTLDLRQMPGIEWDKQLKQVKWGDKLLQYDNFEAFQVDARQGITIRGDGSNERLSGSIYDWKQDILDGRGGNDTLVSTGGGDILTGGTGFDTFVFRSPSDAAIVTDFERGVDTLLGNFNPGWTPPWWEQHGNDQWLVHDGDVVAKLLNVGTDPISITYETPWV